MLNKIVLTCLVIFTLLTFTCNNNPIPPDDIKPGKRDYVWSIDSVDYGSLPGTIQLESIWGSSPTDVWGANGDAPDVRDCLWHYDGIKWTRATEGTPITNFTGNNVVYAVWGSAQNNVWAFGRKINQGTLSAFIMHFNGLQWVDVTPPNVAALSSHLYNVYATEANNIWVGGYEYALYYDGGKWNTFKVADSIIVGSISGNRRFLYLTAYSPYSKNNLRSIYMFSNNRFEKIEEALNYPIKFGLGLWAREKDIKTFENGIISAKIKDNGTIDVNSWYRELTTTTSFGLGSILVQTSKNVFAVGQWNLAYHFNGTDWAQININVPNHTVDPFALFWGVWADGNEVFISDIENGIIFHGR